MLTDKVNAVLDKLDKAPVAQLVTDLRDAVQQADRLLASPSVRQGVDGLRQVGPLLESLKQTSDEAHATLQRAAYDDAVGRRGGGAGLGAALRPGAAAEGTDDDRALAAHAGGLPGEEPECAHRRQARSLRMRMKTRIGIIRRPVGLLLALFVAGCAGSPPTNLYTLSAVGAPAADTRSPQSPAVVALGPVTLPDYIDRPQIVTRKSAYELELAAYDQWAAPLYDMLPRALVEDVALRLPSDRVVAFPQVGDASFDYRIAVDVSRFDVDATGAATLAARWQLYARSDAAGAARRRRHAAASDRRSRLRCLRGFAQRRARRPRRPHRTGR